MTPTQQHIIEKMRQYQLDNGCELSNTLMYRPFGHHKKCPTWTCDWPNGKRVVYSINKAGYNVYQTSN